MAKEKDNTKTEALATINNNMPMALNPANSAGLMELIQENLGGSSLSMSDLVRIKVPAGGATQFAVPNIETGEDDYVKEIEGVIIGHKMARAFWLKSFAETGGGHPPDCSSTDMIHGFGNPGYEVGDGSGIEQDDNGAWLCETCPNNKFGSANGGNGAGKAVQDKRFIFFLSKDSLLPQLLVVPAASLEHSKKYFLGLVAANRPFHSVLTKFTLKKANSKSNITYSEIIPSLSAKLDGEMAKQAKAFADMFAPMLGTTTRRIVEQDGGVDYEEYNESAPL